MSRFLIVEIDEGESEIYELKHFTINGSTQDESAWILPERAIDKNELMERLYKIMNLPVDGNFHMGEKAIEILTKQK